MNYCWLSKSIMILINLTPSWAFSWNVEFFFESSESVARWKGFEQFLNSLISSNKGPLRKLFKIWVSTADFSIDNYLILAFKIDLHLRLA